jgi:hypothetical protein
MEFLLYTKVLSNRRTAQYHKFFRVSAGILHSSEMFKDHCALTLGDNVYCAFTCKVPHLAILETHSELCLGEGPAAKVGPTKVWPTRISTDFAKKCAARYHEAYQWKSLLCCAVCA